MFLLNLFISCADQEITDLNDTFKAKEIFHSAPEDCSFNGGDIVCEISLEDQYGDLFNLWNNYGKVGVIDVSTVWCPYCRTAANLGKELHEEYSEENFFWVTVLIEDNNGEDPDIYDAQVWAGSFELPHPVLSGSRDNIDLEGKTGFSITGFPAFLILDKNFRIRTLQQGWNEYSIRSSVEELLEE